MTDEERKEAERLSEKYVAPNFQRKYEDLEKSCQTLMIYEVRDEVQTGFEAGYKAGRESMQLSVKDHLDDMLRIQDAERHLEAERELSAKLYERLRWLFEANTSDLDETYIIEGVGERWNLGKWIREAIKEYEASRD